MSSISQGRVEEPARLVLGAQEQVSVAVARVIVIDACPIAVLTVGASGVLANDSDADGAPLTASRVSGPSHGTLTLNANGSFS